MILHPSGDLDDNRHPEVATSHSARAASVRQLCASELQWRTARWKSGWSTKRNCGPGMSQRWLLARRQRHLGSMEEPCVAGLASAGGSCPSRMDRSRSRRKCWEDKDGWVWRVARAPPYSPHAITQLRVAVDHHRHVLDRPWRFPRGRTSFSSCPMTTRPTPSVRMGPA